MSNVKDIDKGFERIRRTVGQIDGLTVEVGIFDDEELALRLLVNEFGTRNGDIPARPALTTTMDGNAAEYGRVMAEGTAQVLAGRLSAHQVLDALGKRAAKDVRDAIDGWSDPKNDPATIRQKGRNNPLVDTGAMRDAVKHRVVQI